MTGVVATDHRIRNLPFEAEVNPAIVLGAVMTEATAMTIRQYLRRRTDRYLTCAIAFLLIVGALMAAAPRILAIRIIFAVLIGVALAAGFWSLVEIPCPNCLKSLGGAGFWLSVGRTRGVASRCSHCGISIDADMPAPPKV
jgi:hypothetical protein